MSEDQNENKDVRPWDLLNADKPKSSKELAAKRFEICKTCEFFKPKTNRCSKCGCFMKLKTTLLEAQCPIHKW